MAGAKYTIDASELRQIERRINEIAKQGSALTPALRSIGEELLVIHDERFRQQVSPDGEAWTPLSARYRAKKPRRQDDILTLDGNLGGTLSYQASPTSLQFGTNLVYGAIHHFGGSAEMRASNAAIPARPWLGISSDDEEHIYQILGDFLMQR